MVKILYICQDICFAGAESYALALIRGMSRQQGIKCYLATFYDGPLRSKLADENVEFIEPFGKSNMKSSLEAVRFARESNIDLIHFIDMKATNIAVFAAIFCPGVRLVSTVHGLPELPKLSCRSAKFSLSILFYFVLLKFFIHRFIFVSYDLKERLGKYFKPNKMRVVHNGIDIDEEDCPVRNSEIEGGGYVVGTVGRLEPVKGQKYFISAAKKILDERSDVSFQVVGEGPLESELKDQIKLLGIDGKCELMGFRADARQLIKQMDIFVLPSLHEGIPYVLLEAMAAGRPVICSAVGGIMEVLKDDSLGVLIPSADVDALYKSINRLLNDKFLREQLGSDANAYIKHSFSSDCLVNKTQQIYRDLLRPFSVGL